jgi:hypothetical protein
LLTCHRLARLVARGGTVSEWLSGVAIDNCALDADLAFLSASNPDVQLIRKCAEDLRHLPPLAAVADVVDVGERLTFLNSVMLVDQNGFGYVWRIFGYSRVEEFPEKERMLRGVDWDLALQNFNHYYDEMVVAMREDDAVFRAKLLGAIMEKWQRRSAQLGSLNDEAWRRLQSAPASTRGVVVGDDIFRLLGIGTLKLQFGADRNTQLRENVHVAFALERYRRDRGSYPVDFAVLVPTYLPEAPQDYFSGRPPLYHSHHDRYILYSVGRNGVDDGGRGPRDDPPGDDIVVRMPLPPVKAP